MKILIINAGSSSLKYQLIDTADESVKAKGLCERIGIEGSLLTHKVPGLEDYVVESPMPTHKQAIKLVLDALVDADHGVVKTVDELSLTRRSRKSSKSASRSARSTIRQTSWVSRHARQLCPASRT